MKKINNSEIRLILNSDCEDKLVKMINIYQMLNQNFKPQ